MIIDVLFIFLCAGLLPFLRWQQVEESRNYALVVFSGIYIIIRTLSGNIFWFQDTTSLFVAGFVIWILCSCAWTPSRQSKLDLYMLIGCLVVFWAARTVPKELLFPIVFFPGPVFAAVSIYKLWRGPLHHDDHPYFIFGNCNHFGTFLLVHLFIGIWLVLNVSSYYAPMVLIVAAGIVLSKSRNAIISMITGLFFVWCMAYHWALMFTPVGVILGYLVYRHERKDRPGIISQNRRLLFYIAAVHLIRKKLFFGWGLRTFRKEYPTHNAEILNMPIVKKIIEKAPASDRSAVEAACSHRVHNDYLEIVYELGIIGFVIFMGIFLTLNFKASPIISGLVVAYAVNALFFFPLREVHTAVPFWAVVGAMASVPSQTVIIHPVIAVVVALIVIRVLGDIYVRLQGLVLYDEFMKTPEGDRKCEIIRLAIQRDPYNDKYLTEGYYHHVKTNPAIAFQYASRCMENYSGGKVRWGVFDQYARAVLRFGGFNIARMSLHYALSICPGFKQSEELISQINQIEGAQQQTLKKMQDFSDGVNNRNM